MSMTYAIIMETDCGLEIRKDIPGTKELEKFTDSRILALYGDVAEFIYKVYQDYTAVVLKGETW